MLTDDAYAKLSLALRDIVLLLGCPPEQAVPGRILFSRIGSGWHLYAGSWFYPGMVAVNVDDFIEAVAQALGEAQALANARAAQERGAAGTA